MKPSDCGNSEWALFHKLSDDVVTGRPVEPDDLFFLVRRLAYCLMELDYDQLVYQQGAGGKKYRMTRLFNAACDALGQRTNEAIEDGRLDFAASLSQADREIFLNGSQAQLKSVLREHKLAYLTWLSEDSET